MILDFSNNVTDCKNLTCPPFPLFKKRARVQVPSIPAVQVNGSSAPTNYDAFITDIENLEAKLKACKVAFSIYPRAVNFSLPAPLLRSLTHSQWSCSPRRALPCSLELLFSIRRYIVQILMLSNETTGLGGATMIVSESVPGCRCIYLSPRFVSSSCL